MSICIKVILTPEAFTRKSGAHLPRYETEGSAGMDLRAAKPSEAHPWKVYGRDEHVFEALTGSLRLFPGQRALIPTGLRLAIPEGYEGQIRGRSGLALRHGVALVKGVATIDADYRGVLGVVLINHGLEPFDIEPGDRIAQLVFAKVERADLAIVDELDATERGSGGFGHTGV